MKTKNFELANIDLEQDGEVYDLHNNFNFIGFSYSVAKQELKLEWLRSKGEWVPQNTPESITLIAKNVSHFSANPRDPDIPFTEDDCLDCVAFVMPSEKTEDSYIINTPIDNEFHYVFQFMSGLKIRIQAEEAECIVN